MKKFLSLLILPFLLFSCAALENLIKKKPEISLKRFDIDSISLKDITFLFEIELNNPYPIGFKLEDVGFNVQIEGNQLFKTRTKKGVTVKAGGSEVTPVKVTLVYEDIMKIIKNYAERDYLACRIDIDTVIPLPKALESIKKNITFKHTVEKKIPALKPSFRIANVNVKAPTIDEIKRSLVETGKKNLDPKNLLGMLEGLISGRNTAPDLDLTSLDVPISISFDVEVKNNTRARLACRDLTYNFLVNEAKILSGTTGSVSEEGAASIIRITNTFSSKALGKSVISMFNSRSGSYQLTGFSNLKLPDEIRKDPLKLEFNEKGPFKLN
jgi:LEA14-like dessication related protein